MSLRIPALRAGVLALLIAGFLGAFAAPALAAPGTPTSGSSINCDALITDQTTDQVVSSTTSVGDAVNRLADKVTLHVVVYDGSEDGNSVTYTQALISQCPQWTLNNPAEIAPNVVLVVMDLHHHITIKDGDNYKGKLDPKLGSIVHDAKPKYDGGDYPAALTSLLNGIHDTLYPGFPWAAVLIIAAIVLVLACLSGGYNSYGGGSFWEGFFFASLINSGGSSSGSGGGSWGGSSSGGFSGNI